MSGLTVEVTGLTKQFGSVTAVDDLSFAVAPGQVTGFLGPNGAGKTTTLRCLLGLVAPTSGTATIGGSPYAALDRPLQTVGSVLEASSFHPGRSALRHLEVLALASGRGPRTGRRGAGPWWGCTTSPIAGSAATRSGCASGSAWPARCSATPASSSSTSPPTASTRPGSPGCVASCGPLPARAGPSWSPAMC